MDNTMVKFRKSSVKIGVICIAVIMVSMFIPIIYLRIAYGVFPEWSLALSTWGTVILMFGAFYIIEPFAYFPILGLGGTYMAFTTGNISDARVSSSLTAQKSLGIKQGTKEAEIISTIGIGGSVVTTTIAVLLAVAIGTVVVSALPDAIVVGLQKYCVPCVLGSIFVQFCSAEPKLWFIAVIATVLYWACMKINITNFAIIMLLAVVISILVARVLYKKGFFGAVENKKTLNEAENGNK